MNIDLDEHWSHDFEDQELLVAWFLPSLQTHLHNLLWNVFLTNRSENFHPP